eukprot:scaffold1294_cov167-Amphora_coffeaeformis.AAC.2
MESSSTVAECFMQTEDDPLCCVRVWKSHTLQTLERWWWSRFVPRSRQSLSSDHPLCHHKSCEDAGFASQSITDFRLAAQQPFGPVGALQPQYGRYCTATYVVVRERCA